MLIPFLLLIAVNKLTLKCDSDPNEKIYMKRSHKLINARKKLIESSQTVKEVN